MLFTEFLALVKVIRMLYGLQIADEFFKKNIDRYYDLSYDELSKSIKLTESTVKTND